MPDDGRWDLTWLLEGQMNYKMNGATTYIVGGQQPELINNYKITSLKLLK